MEGWKCICIDASAGGKRLFPSAKRKGKKLGSCSLLT